MLLDLKICGQVKTDVSQKSDEWDFLYYEKAILICIAHRFDPWISASFQNGLFYCCIIILQSIDHVQKYIGI